MINKPRPNLAPNSSVIKQALELCAAFGNDKADMIDLLKKMLGVQVHNENIIKQANSVVEGEAQLIQKQNDFVDFVKDQKNISASRNAELDEQKQVFITRQKEWEDEISRSDHELQVREQTVLEKEKRVLAELSRVEAIRHSCTNLENAWKERKGKLDKREQFLQRIIDLVHDNLPRRS